MLTRPKLKANPGTQDCIFERARDSAGKVRVITQISAVIDTGNADVRTFISE